MRKVKVWALVAMMAGTTFATSCKTTDIRKNIVSGFLSFVENYSQSIFNGLAPTPTDVYAGDWP